MSKTLLYEVIPDLHTIQDLLRWTVSYFSSQKIYYGHGADNPWDEALQLILPIIHLPLDIPLEIRNTNLTITERKHIIKLVHRRVQERIPTAYLTNKSWFCGYEFYVDQRVLIPRSPIGELIENRFSGLIDHDPKNILDMCTGSGCMAIACAYFFPNSKIDAVDISAATLKVAQHNIISHFLTNRIKLIRNDLFSQLPVIKYDIIVANPPYIRKKDLSDLPPEYSHEPELSLIGGDHGLELVYRILMNAANYLSENGILICEVGYNMQSIITRYPNINFNWVHFNNGGEGVFALTRDQIIRIYDIIKNNVI